ncbi:MAG: hypothetical protein ACHQZR_08865 [Candidatus Limnocylindrales bacterium]
MAPLPPSQVGAPPAQVPTSCTPGAAEIGTLKGIDNDPSTFTTPVAISTLSQVRLTDAPGVYPPSVAVLGSPAWPSFGFTVSAEPMASRFRALASHIDTSSTAIEAARSTRGHDVQRASAWRSLAVASLMTAVMVESCHAVVKVGRCVGAPLTPGAMRSHRAIIRGPC